MNLVMISPGYPAEMAYFTQALAAVGATVIALGDQPPSALPEPARIPSHTTSRWTSPTKAACWPRFTGSRSTPRSTRSSACGSRTWSSPRGSGSRSDCRG